MVYFAGETADDQPGGLAYQPPYVHAHAPAYAVLPPARLHMAVVTAECVFVVAEAEYPSA